jgi:hypothetical protein
MWCQESVLESGAISSRLLTPYRKSAFARSAFWMPSRNGAEPAYWLNRSVLNASTIAGEIRVSFFQRSCASSSSGKAAARYASRSGRYSTCTSGSRT